MTAVEKGQMLCYAAPMALFAQPFIVDRFTDFLRGYQK